MTIGEMHDLFRVLGQQVGMQLVRGILPQHIDSFINIEISETVRNLLLTNAHTVLQDDVNLQSSTLNPINAFRTLYRRFYIKDGSDENAFTKNTDCTVVDLSNVEDPMLYLGFNITYSDTLSKRIACRLIGASVLETTLRDFCNGADEENPIAVLLNIDGKECVEIYTGLSNKEIQSISVSYIKSPNKVKFIGETGNIDCDLPDYMHYSIVSGAANRYLLSLNTQPTTSNNVRNNN